MLKERQKNILDAVIQEYIKTARPVASRDIAKKPRLGISPATARNEMLKLDELGYLEQPHTSAGRVPTDQGYRFFVDNLIGDLPLGERERGLISKLFKITDENEFVRDASRTIAHISRSFTAFGLTEGNIFYAAGFSEVLSEPEFQEPESIRMFGQLVECWEDKARNFFENLDPEVDGQIFIGRENLLKEARDCAVFISRFLHPRGFEGFITMVGPKRTNYQKHQSLINELRQN